MQIKKENFTGNILSLFRSLGYQFQRQAGDEMVFVKAVGRSEFPRFHCYTRQDGQTLTINLHLDQKRPSYEGTSAHGGEYDGPVVETEATRISQLIR